MQNYKSKIFSDSIIYTVLPKISYIIAIVSLPWISPYISLNDYGIFGILISYITIFQTTISLGQNIIIQNAYFTHGHKFYLVWGRSFAVMIIAAFVSSLLFGISSFFFLRTLLLDRLSIVIVLASFFFIFSPFEIISQNYFVLKQKPLNYSIGLSISGIIGSIISIISIRYYQFGYLGWILSLSSITVINFCIFSYLIIFKEKILPNFKLKKYFFLSSVKSGFFLLPHQISLYILNSSDRILLNFFNVPISSIGYYSQGYNLGSQGNLLVNGVFQSLSKNLQESFRKSDSKSSKFVRKVIIVVPIIISLILFIISLWLKEVFNILFINEKLNKSYPVAIIVLCSFMYWSIYTIFTLPLSIQNKPFSISIISMIAALINVVGNILFIPKYGINASIFFTYISYVLFGFIGLFNKENRIYLNRYLPILKFCTFMLLFNFSLTIFSYLAVNFSFFTKSFISLLVTVFIIVFLKFTNKLFSND